MVITFPEDQSTVARTLVEKIWDAHVVAGSGDSDYLYLDRIVLHERTGSIALTSLLERHRSVARPAQAFAVMDHILDTRPGRGDTTMMPGGAAFITSLRQSAAAHRIRLFDVNDPDQGVSHLVSAEQGIALPGLTLVCPDSHSCTLGALGCLAFGIGTSDCEHALATEQLRVRRPLQMRVNLRGSLHESVTAKDLVLYLIRRVSADGAAGHAVEFAGSAVDAMELESRFTLCNMAAEFGAVTGIVAPDEKTVAYLQGREYAPSGALWSKAERDWQSLASDADAKFDREIDIDAYVVSPMVTWGTSPEQVVRIAEPIPGPAAGDSRGTAHADQHARSLNYMGLASGSLLEGLPIDGAFIGSCTNSRLSDLRMAAKILQGNFVADGVRALCTPGSAQVKQAAEAEGLDRIFKLAGFEWREPGCSLCFYAGGEGFEPGDRVLSTTNRNIEGRQGPGVRTHLASPATVAASAIAGRIADPTWQRRF